MKALSLTLLPLVASAAPDVLSRRQEETAGGIGDLVGTLFEEMVPESVNDTPSEIFPDAKRTVTRWGPYNMVGNEEPKPSGNLPSLDPNGQGFVSLFNEGICHECTVLGGVITLQLADGTDAMDDNVYIHHILSFDVDKKTDPFVSTCATEDGQPATGGLGDLVGGMEGLTGTRFLGAGEDNKNTFKLYSNPDGGFDGGFQVGPDDRFVAQIDIVNYNPDPREVFIAMDMEYLEGVQGSDAYSALLSVEGCSLKPINSDPNGPANTTSDKFPILSDGSLISSRGHLHTGGVAMVLSLNDQETCVSNAEYGGSVESDGEETDTIQSMTDCNEITPVKEGDYLAITAIYDLKAHPAMEGGEEHSHGGGGMGGDMMGQWSIIFSPSGEEQDA